jgi:hypothetical protein
MALPKKGMELHMLGRDPHQRENNLSITFRAFQRSQEQP